MADEPRNHPVFLTLLALVAIGTVPVGFVGRGGWSWLGLPLWLWSSLAFTFALSALTVWGILRYWTDDGELRNRTGNGGEEDRE